MTPLAHQIVLDSTLPLAKRRHGPLEKELRLLEGVHFFDVSAVREVAEELSDSIGESYTKQEPIAPELLAFLPAQRVWLETTHPACDRVGILLEDQGELAEVQIVWRQKDGTVILLKESFYIPMKENGEFSTVYAEKLLQGKNKDKGFILEAWKDLIYAYLALINTPRVIGRRQHMPHAGLQRKLAAARGMVGKFPLHAWSEIVLEVTPPVVDEGEHIAGLTGGKALHFCRAHLRIRLGKLELVSAHWRGDPALGIKQSRYRVEPPRA